MTRSIQSVAVVGCGHWGRNLVRNFSALGTLAMVCEPSPSGRALASERAPGVPLVSDIEQVLCPGIAAVAIATPAETHHDLARRALLAGKDVFVEKPLALSYEEGAELVDLAESRGLMLMVGHVLEYHPAVVELLRLVRGGDLGKPQYIYSNRLSLGKIRREENILWSFAPHDIAVILRLAGTLPSQVIACGGSYVQAQVADVTVTHLLFDSGVRAHVHVSWLHPFREQRLVVVGDRRMASFDDIGKKLILYDKRVDFPEGQPMPHHGEGIEVSFDATEPLELECRAFLRAVEDRVPPLTDGPSGLRVLQVLQAAQRSLVLNGEPVHLSMDGPRARLGVVARCPM